MSNYLKPNPHKKQLGLLQQQLLLLSTYVFFFKYLENYIFV